MRLGYVLRGCLPVLVLILLAAGASAESRDWSGAVDANWYDPGNWLPVGPPDPTDQLQLLVGSAHADRAVTIGEGGLVSIAAAGAASPCTLEVDGTLTIDAGGVLSVAGGQVVGGEDCAIGAAGGAGVLTACGAGTSVYFAGQMGVGGGVVDDPNATNGSMDILDGAFVQADGEQCGVGLSFDGVGRVVIRGGDDGNASTWRCGALNVGFWGRGEIEVSGGGQLITPAGTLVAAIGEGRVDVAGVGSRWETGGLVVGVGGWGEATVSDGAVVEANALQLGTGMWIEAYGHLTVSGAGSRVTVEPNESVTSSVQIGGQGVGVLTVEAGGVVDANMDAAVGMADVPGLDANGRVTIDGEGSRWRVGGGLYLGGTADEDANGTASVTVRRGGELAVGGAVKLWNATSALTLDGGRAACGEIESHGELVLAEADIDGALRCGADGTLRVPLTGPGVGPPPRASGAAVRGDAHLAGTLALDWRAVPGDPNSRFGGVYDLLTCAGELTGEFAVLGGTIGEAYVAGIDYDADVPGEPDANAVRVTLHDQLDGDCNLDGLVGRDDFLALRAGFGSAATEWFDGDLSFDGVVDARDYVALKRSCGDAVPAPAAAPEPASLCLLAAAAVALLRRRR